MDNIKHIKRIEFAPNSKYLKTMYMVNGEKLYKNVKLYAFILACVLFSNVIRIIVECFFMFDLLGFLQLIFNPFMGGRVSSLEMKVKPIMLLYPLIMFIWNFFRLRSQAEKKVLNIKQLSDISWIEFTEHSILYDIDGDKKDINYSDIRSYREWKNDIFVETYDEKTLVVPCNNKIELHNVSILLKEKIRKEFKISCSNKKEWVDKIYSTFQKAKKTKLFIISLWLNFSYFYMTGLDFKNFNFVKAFAVRTYVEGSTFRCFRVYEVLIVCFILTIIAYINDLQYKRKIEKWY